MASAASSSDTDSASWVTAICLVDAQSTEETVKRSLKAQGLLQSMKGMRFACMGKSKKHNGMLNIDFDSFRSAKIAKGVYDDLYRKSRDGTWEIRIMNFEKDGLQLDSSSNLSNIVFAPAPISRPTTSTSSANLDTGTLEPQLENLSVGSVVNSPEPVENVQRGLAPEDPEGYTNLFVKNLPQHVDEMMLDDMFKVFGVIRSRRIIKDDLTHVSKGYGFIDFARHEDAVKAWKNLDGHVFSNKQRLYVNPAEKHGVRVARLSRQYAMLEAEEMLWTKTNTEGTGCLILLCNLVTSIEDDGIRHMFKEFGKILQIKSVKENGEHYVFVRFTTQDFAHKACLKMKEGYTIRGQKVDAIMASSKNKRRDVNMPFETFPATPREVELGWRSPHRVLQRDQTARVPFRGVSSYRGSSYRRGGGNGGGGDCVPSGSVKPNSSTTAAAATYKRTSSVGVQANEGYQRPGRGRAQRRPDVEAALSVVERVFNRI